MGFNGKPQWGHSPPIFFIFHVLVLLWHVIHDLVVYASLLRRIAFAAVCLVEFGTAGATVGAVPYMLVGELISFLVCTFQMRN